MARKPSKREKKNPIAGVVKRMISIPGATFSWLKGRAKRDASKTGERPNISGTISQILHLEKLREEVSGGK